MSDTNTKTECVECGFGYTRAVRNLLITMLVVPVIVLILLFCCLVEIREVGDFVCIFCIAVLCIAVMFSGFIIQQRLGKGTITANEKGVDVSYGFLSRKIPMDNIANVRCEVESTGTRYGGVIYTMFLLIETKDEKSYRYELELPIDKDYPAKHPGEYKNYLHNQPMMAVYNYINKRVQTHKIQN